MTALPFYKCLSDQTRLKTLLMLTAHGELCVCELTGSLGETQPKISRHLALLRQHNLIQDRRVGQWVYYRLHDQLPAWCREVLELTLAENHRMLATHNKALISMERPSPACCD